MLALSIRQPYAELILRGIKTVEYHSRSTRIIGERFYVYAPKKLSMGRVTRADNIVVPTETLPAWMIELAEQAWMIEPGALLPTGVIVGSAVIEKVSRVDSRSAGTGRAMYRWRLSDVKRATRLRKPERHAQPVWFRPF